MMGKQPKKPKTAPKAALPSTQVMTLQNRVEGLQEMLGNAMAQIQQLKQQMNDNWTKFVFHDHRRFDSAGPQFYSKDYERAWIQEQERQKAAQAPPAAPEQAPPAEQPAKREKK